MNSSSPSASTLLPTVRGLFWNDMIFRRAVNTAGFALMWAVGIWWVTRPMPNVAVNIDRTVEEAAGKFVPPVALAVTGVALIIAVWRWMYVRKVFTEGAVVEGKVVKLQCDKWQTSAGVDQSHGSKTVTRYSYYIAISYTVNGEARTLQRKLPNSGFTFGLREGGPVELMVHKDRPGKPLIRPVYLSRR